MKEYLFNQTYKIDHITNAFFNTWNHWFSVSKYIVLERQRHNLSIIHSNYKHLGSSSKCRGNYNGRCFFLIVIIEVVCKRKRLIWLIIYLPRMRLISQFFKQCFAMKLMVIIQPKIYQIVIHVIIKISFALWNHTESQRITYTTTYILWFFLKSFFCEFSFFKCWYKLGQIRS